MGYAAVTFHGVNFNDIKISDVCRLIRDCDVLMDIIHRCDELRTETEQFVKNLKEELKFVKIYLSAKTQGCCTKHSVVGNLILLSECTGCRTENVNIDVDVIDLTTADQNVNSYIKVEPYGVII